MSEIVSQLSATPWLLAVLCSVAGYLAGSVSSARIVYYMVTKRKEIEPFSEPIPHSDEMFESKLVSATLITRKLGKKYGMITSLMDMLKVVLPLLLVKLVFTDEPYYLLVALFGVTGHNFPVWYGFVGGRGESPILAVILVINWFGLFIVNAAAAVLGFIVGSVLVLRWGGYVLIIGWLWYWFDDWRYGLFMALVNVVFWVAQSEDLKKFSDLKREKGLKFSEEDVSDFILMGKGIGRALDRYSLYALLKKMIKKDNTEK